MIHNAVVSLNSVRVAAYRDSVMGAQVEVTYQSANHPDVRIRLTPDEWRDVVRAGDALLTLFTSELVGNA